VHSSPVGRVGTRVVIIDDMLGTAGMLVFAYQKLMEADVEEIYIPVTHGLFTGSHRTELWSLGMLCTDTVPVPRRHRDHKHLEFIGRTAACGRTVRHRQRDPTRSR
jgi:phosphoribosylpyrophosphate synthetase